MNNTLKALAAMLFTLLAACRGDLMSSASSNPYDGIDLNDGGFAMGDYDKSGARMYDFAFPTAGANFTMTTYACFVGFGVDGSTTSWVAVNMCVNEILSLPQGDVAVITFNPTVMSDTLRIGNIRDFNNPKCAEGEDTEEMAECWYMPNRYLGNAFVESDINDVEGLQGAQYSIVTLDGEGLVPGRTSI